MVASYHTLHYKYRPKENSVYWNSILFCMLIGYFFTDIDHSARVMHVITWNKSSRGLSMNENRDANYSEKQETLAMLLEKMLAWEKKLLDEVKVYLISAVTLAIISYLLVMFWVAWVEFLFYTI